MENFVTQADFIDNIWAISLSSSGYSDDLFVNFIAEHQYNVLIDLLGTELYNEFEAGLATIPILDKWTDLKDGVSGYTDCYGYVKNYKGLAYMLQPYIFYHWLYFNEFKQTTTGTVITLNENSVKVTEYQRKDLAFKAWNEFIKRYNDTYLYLYTNIEDYNDVDIHHKHKYNNSLLTLRTIQ